MPVNLAVEDEKLTRHIPTCSTSVTGIRTQGGSLSNPRKKQRACCVCLSFEDWKDVPF